MLFQAFMHQMNDCAAGKVFSIDNRASNLGLLDFNFQQLHLVAPLVKQNGIVQQIIQSPNKLDICLENLLFSYCSFFSADSLAESNLPTVPRAAGTHKGILLFRLFCLCVSNSCIGSLRHRGSRSF